MLCYSTGSLPDSLSFSEIRKILAPTPFRGVELVVNASMLKLADNVQYWQSIRQEFESHELCFRNVHLGAPFLLGSEAHQPGLSALEPSMQRRKVEAAIQATKIADQLGSPHVTLTTGLPESENTMEVQVLALKSALATLIKKKPKPLVYLIEQEPEHVIRATAQLLHLSQEFAGEVFANFDIGHSHVLGENISDCILELAPFLMNIHLEDIEGRVHAHKLFGEGDVDFAAVFSALRKIKYAGDYTPDLYPFKDDYARAIGASVQFLQEHEVLGD